MHYSSSLKVNNSSTLQHINRESLKTFSIGGEVFPVLQLDIVFLDTSMYFITYLFLYVDFFRILLISISITIYIYSTI
jgi:hypothetical protein